MLKVTDGEYNSNIFLRYTNCDHTHAHNTIWISYVEIPYWQAFNDPTHFNSFKKPD